jgi:hypothetical protein
VPCDAGQTGGFKRWIAARLQVEKPVTHYRALENMWAVSHRLLFCCKNRCRRFFLRHPLPSISDRAFLRFPKASGKESSARYRGT